MGWKNLPYWFRGGIIVIIIYVILLFSTFGYMTIIMGSIFDILGISSEGGNSFSRFYNWWLLPFITFFIIGTIIGWIYGKIKSK